ncbi:MAG: hypothetical protein ACRCRR_04130 [Rickettsia sp.]
MLEGTTTAIGAATEITFNMQDMVISTNMNYNNLVNGAIAFPANGLPVIIDNAWVTSYTI